MNFRGIDFSCTVSVSLRSFIHKEFFVFFFYYWNSLIKQAITNIATNELCNLEIITVVTYTVFLEFYFYVGFIDFNLKMATEKCQPRY